MSEHSDKQSENADVPSLQDSDGAAHPQRRLRQAEEIMILASSPTKKKKVNEGEVPQYYVEDSHEPIITPDEFDKVQIEFERRKRISRQYSGKSIFSSRIICGDCGSFFGSKVWNSTSKYRRVIWQCNNKFKGDHKCETPHLDEKTIKARFIAAFNAILDSKDNILEDCRLMQAMDIERPVVLGRNESNECQNRNAILSFYVDQRKCQAFVL